MLFQKRRLLASVKGFWASVTQRTKCALYRTSGLSIYVNPYSSSHWAGSISFRTYWQKVPILRVLVENYGNLPETCQTNSCCLWLSFFLFFVSTRSSIYHHSGVTSEPSGSVKLLFVSSVSNVESSLPKSSAISLSVSFKDYFTFLWFTIRCLACSIGERITLTNSSLTVVMLPGRSPSIFLQTTGSVMPCSNRETHETNGI